jgi:hypothetical protein
MSAAYLSSPGSRWIARTRSRLATEYSSACAEIAPRNVTARIVANRKLAFIAYLDQRYSRACGKIFAISEVGPAAPQAVGLRPASESFCSHDPAILLLIVIRQHRLRPALIYPPLIIRGNCGRYRRTHSMTQPVTRILTPALAAACRQQPPEPKRSRIIRPPLRPHRATSLVFTFRTESECLRH